MFIKTAFTKKGYLTFETASLEIVESTDIFSNSFRQDLAKIITILKHILNKS
jgi:hypothetical protein